jgi:hypothetical protein
MTKIKTPKKLIEVALPLDDINVVATRAALVVRATPQQVFGLASINYDLDQSREKSTQLGSAV